MTWSIPVEVLPGIVTQGIEEIITRKRRGRGPEEKKRGPPAPPDADQHATNSQSQEEKSRISTHEVVGARHVAI
jgi:hypothetical protein